MLGCIKDCIAMETIYDEDDTDDSIDDNVVLIKLEKDFTVSRDCENVYYLYRVSYENIALVTGGNKFPPIPELVIEDVDAEDADTSENSGKIVLKKGFFKISNLHCMHSKYFDCLIILLRTYER